MKRNPIQSALDRAIDSRAWIAERETAERAERLLPLRERY